MGKCAMLGLLDRATNGRLPNFPVLAGKFPVLQNIFPVNLRRELFKKWLQHRGFLLRNRLSEPQNRKIPCKIPC